MKFELEVVVFRRPNMRDDNLEFMLHAGQNILRQIFDEEKIDNTVTNVVFYFPERWMNIVEERSLLDRLEHYCPNLKSVTIYTQSVYIIQCTKAEYVKIMSSQEELDYIASVGKLPGECINGQQAFKVPGVRDFSKLQML